MSQNTRPAAAWRRAGLLVTAMTLASGLAGDRGAAQTLPRAVTHGPVQARVVDRAPVRGGVARLPIPAELAYRINPAGSSAGLGDPVCDGGSVAWHGQPLPGGEQGTLAPGAFFNPGLLNNQGRIAFYAQVEGADRNQGIFTADAEGLQVVALGCGGAGGSGQTAGCGDPSPIGGSFSGFFAGTFFAPDINDAGDVLFIADIHEGDAPRGLFLYRGDTGAIDKVAAVGDSLAEGVIDWLGFGNLNNDGVVVFAARLVGAAETELFLWDGATPSRYVAVGDPAPGGGVFSLIVSEFLGFPDGTFMPGGPLPGLNEQGQITFRSLVAGGEAERGIFLSQDGVHEWLVRVGDPVPGGGTYVDFQAAQLNDAGEVAFFADIDEGGEFNTAGWIVGSPGNWRRAVTFLDEIGEGVVVGLAFSRNPMTALSNQGDLLFWSTLRFPDESEAETMILSRANGGRLVVAQQGEPTPDGGTYGSMDAWPALNHAHQGQIGAGTPGLPGQLNTHFVLTFCTEGGVPVLGFDPSGLDFGDVEVGSTSPPQTATLSNTGDADATGVTFSGLPGGGFEADTSACGDILPADESCAISVTFTPVEPGPAEATLHVSSDEGAMADLNLSGNGVEGGEEPIIDVDPDSIASMLPPGGTEARDLTIANLGGGVLQWEVTEEGGAGARATRPAVRRTSAGPAAGGEERRGSRTVMKLGAGGVLAVSDAAASAAGAGTGGVAGSPASGATAWSVDSVVSIAASVAIDASDVWGAWNLNGSHLAAYPIADNGIPDLEFPAQHADGFVGVTAAKGADRALFVERDLFTGDENIRVHAFTSQSDGTADWSFELPSLVGSAPTFRNVAVSRDGSTAAATGFRAVGEGEESTLYVFDAATGDLISTWSDPSRMQAVDLTDDGSLALVSQDAQATLIDTATGEVVFQTPGSGGNAVDFRISGDGRVFVVGGFDFDVYEHDGTTYQRVIHLTQPNTWFGQASVVSRDGSTVGTFGGDFASGWLQGEVFLFDVASREMLGSFPVSGSGEFQGTPVDAAASDDGSVLAFASWGTQNNDWPEVMVFSRDVELIGEIDFPGSAFAVDLSPDGGHVVGGAKAVHANQFDTGGRIELLELAGGEPGDCALPDWVSVDPLSGSVPGGESQVASVTFDAAGLEPGDYGANLCVASNDPATPLVTVSLSLTVEEAVPAELEPVALVVDPEASASDGNGLFEPGETVDVAPSWRNDGDTAQSLTGEASQFTGPAGADYSVEDDAADYGMIDPDATASCEDLGNCYLMELDDPASRPVTHWDATFEELLSDGSTTKIWTLHIGDSFSDVARASIFYSWIETLLHNGVTGGCTETTYCPAAPNTRAQMSVFLLKALEGPGYAPPACTGVFADVPCPSLFANWIEDLAGRGVTAGCGGGNYCPNASVSRDQMAVFLLKTLEGPGYTPPACAGVFGDVPCPSLFATWIEDLVDRGITAGCGGGNYCPGSPVSRDQMAVFLSKTFGLTLYGP